MRRFHDRNESRDNQEKMFERHAHLRTLGDELRCNKLADKFYEAVKERDIKPLMSEIGFTGQITEQMFFKPLEMLLNAEEAYQAVEMRKHDKIPCKVIRHVEMDEFNKEIVKSRTFWIELKGQADNSLLDPSDIVVLECPDTRKYFQMPIGDFKGDLIHLKTHGKRSQLSEEELDSIVDGHSKLNVYFVSSGISYRACQGALEQCKTSLTMRERIFERADGDIMPDVIAGLEPMVRLNFDFELIGDSDNDRLYEKLNREQRQAVIGILEGKCRPKPYILFGPPGTGKTHTLVEAIVQIYKRTNKTVLITVNSNTCARQTYEKLKETGAFKDHELLHLKAGFFASELKLRVVVCTNIKSCSLQHKFDWVIIDEAGHAHEAESLVPICRLMADGVLVLAGDPKQLGPVVQFGEAAKNGLEGSMLERIFDWSIYQRKGDDKKFDSRYITKLLECFRCDERILHISNELFYENELRCLSSTPKSVLKILRLGSPLQLHLCTGEESQPPSSHSWANREELNQVVDIVIRLYKLGYQPSQVGVMSPYRAQVREITKRLASLLRSVRVDLNSRFPVKVRKTRKVPKNQEAIDADRRNMEGGWNNSNLDADSSKHYQKLEVVEMIDEEYWELQPTDWMCKVDTVDSFQGGEREVIIFSSVRTRGSARFLDHPKRFNVALSRAKWLMVVVGCEQILRASMFWRRFLDKAREDTKEWPPHSLHDVDPFEQSMPLCYR